MVDEEDDDVRPSSPPPPGEEEGQWARRRRIEKLLRETIRRGLEKGIVAGLGTLSKTDSAVRDFVSDVKLPKEIVHYLFSTVDETKNALVRVVAREVREFLEATDVAAELQKALTTLSFEIKTEIRFIPNEAGTGIKPEVKSVTIPRRRGRRRDGEDSETGADTKATDEDSKG